MDNKTEMTFSVKQLAQMLGRSEQTVRRWKDQGKLVASEGGEGGGLAFTESAVRDLLNKNPRLLDRATPELVMLLYTDSSEIPTQRNTNIANYLTAGLAAAGSMLVPGGPLLAAGAIGAAKLASNRKAQEKEEKEEDQVVAVRWRGKAHHMDGKEPEAPEATEPEERPVLDTPQKADSYLYRLLLDREQKVKESIAQLNEELEQIQREKAILEAEYAQKREELTP